VPEGNQHTDSGLQSSHRSLNRNISFAEARRDGHVDLVDTGGGYAGEIGLNGSAVDSKCERAGDGRGASEWLPGRDMRVGWPEAASEEYDVVTRLGGYGAIAESLPGGAKNVVGSSAKGP